MPSVGRGGEREWTRDHDYDRIKRLQAKAPVAKPSSGRYYVNPNGNYADTMAELTRSQHADYKNRFRPIEDRLIGLATGNELYDRQLARNTLNSNLNYNQANAQAEQASSMYGLGDLRSAQQKNNLALTNALGLASMNNESRSAIGDLQRDIITGQSSGARQAVNKVGNA
ncbi:hypothetical protein LZS85_15500 [Aliivibrio fischeri]|uniref:hypothetical protein n=1 Tax=Aliivibrio fischeri TaxID=668 RepID=UPI001F30348F|nr:hypothetical protein [Aliivibrio fischeri]MCE7567528.1 hypothetical protein [Aliivibrio fischeri]